METRGNAFSEAELELLNKMFCNSDRLDGIIASNKKKIVDAAQSEKDCFILHQDETVDKRPPADGEIYFGLYICKMGETSYILARPV